MCEICDPKNKYSDCICNSEWKNFDSIFTDIINTKSVILEKSLKISTITLCCNFNCDLNLKNLCSKYSYSIKYVPNTKKTADQRQAS